MDKIEKIFIKCPWLGYIIDFEDDIRRYPRRLYRRQVNAMDDGRWEPQTNFAGYSCFTSVEGVYELSIAQIPVPVPTSKIRCGD
jgi:hypothetical protein